MQRLKRFSLAILVAALASSCITPQQWKEYKQECIKKHWQNLSDEERAKIVYKKLKEYYSNLSRSQ